MTNKHLVRRVAKRDNFTPAQRQALAKRVNYHCSICDATTVGPNSYSEKALSIGVAAHIKAASPGGPRYDPNQSQEARRSGANGIWLCANCSIVIDADATAYPVERLLELKSKAEALAQSRLGKRPAPALPMPSSPDEIKRAVEIFCMTEAARTEALDSRFAVSVSHFNGATIYELQAKREVSAQIIVGPEDSERFCKGLQDLHDYGGVAQFDSIEARMEGSPLFQSKTSTFKRLEFSSRQHHAVLALKLTSPSTNTFLEFHGNLSGGRKGIRFQGKTLGNLVSIVLRSDIDASDCTLNLDINADEWQGKPILRLPYFDRIRELGKVLGEGASAAMSLDIEGQEVFSGTGTLPCGVLLHAHNRFLRHIEVLRRLDRFFGLGLDMPLSLKEVFVDEGNFDELLQLICIGEAEDPEMTITLAATATREFSELLEKVRERRPIDLLLKQEVCLHILGRDYGYYVVEFGCSESVVDIVGPSSLKPGADVRLSCRPARGTLWNAKLETRGRLRDD